MTRASEYVQYGCGLSAPPGWRNFDASLRLKAEQAPLVGRLLRRAGLALFAPGVEFGDIVAGLPLAHESCRGVYCSHVLEHLALDDFRVALRHTRDYLKPEGIFRLVVPDLEALSRAYLASSAPDAAIAFMRDSGLGRQTRRRSLAGFLREWVTNAPHLWMWDFKSVAAEIERAGFQAIRRARPGDSSDSRFLEVEDPDRWQDCLGMECVK